MDHPVELSLEEQIDEIYDYLDEKEQGVARQVRNDGSIADLSPKQLGVWNGGIWPKVRRMEERRQAEWRKHLMGRDD